MIDAMLGELELVCGQRVSYYLDLDVADDKYHLWFATSTWQVESTGTILEAVISSVFLKAVEACIKQNDKDSEEVSPF
jgi:hypothetical protein